MITDRQTAFICDYANKEAEKTCPDKILNCGKCHHNQVSFLNKEFPHVEWYLDWDAIKVKYRPTGV